MPNDPRPRRQSLRLPAYDYSQAGAYFITVCTQNHFMLFGEVIDSDVRLNESERRYGIPEILRGFKTFSARRINERAGKRGVLWQRGYYERVIRNEKALDRIRAYIPNNPAGRMTLIIYHASGVCRERAGLKPA